MTKWIKTLPTEIQNLFEIHDDGRIFDRIPSVCSRIEICGDDLNWHSLVFTVKSMHHQAGKGCSIHDYSGWGCSVHSLDDEDDLESEVTKTSYHMARAIRNNLRSSCKSSLILGKIIGTSPYYFFFLSFKNHDMKPFHNRVHHDILSL